MEHARKMALVDPRLLETLRSPPPTYIVSKVMQGLDAEMTSIFDHKNVNDGDKVKLCNQVLQRYNHLSDRRGKQPTRVVVVNDDAATATATPEKPTVAPSTAAPTAVEADIVDSVPKTIKVKAKKLVDCLKTQLSWTDRGELLHDGTPVPGSNVVDLVKEKKERKRRKNYPVGWQAFAQQLKRINLPMELVGNVERSRYIRHAGTATAAATTPLAVIQESIHYLVEPPMAVDQWNSPKVLEKNNVIVGGRHWMVGSPFKRILLYNDSTVNHGIGSGHISLGSPMSAVQDRRLLPTDRNACLGVVYDRRLLPTDRNACLGVVYDRRLLPTDRNACLGVVYDR